MMEYILFDLDGTITDPKEGIVNSFHYALKAMNIIIEDVETLVKHIGPPMRDSFRESYGLDEADTERAVEKYREYYEAKGIFENIVYDGIEKLLSKLKEIGKTIIMATSKPEVFARRIMEHFHLEEYFDDICGATLDASLTKKDDIIKLALERNNITQLSKAVMIGDRKFDIIGAKAAGISSIGVLYGYGDIKELNEAGADRIAVTVDDLWDVIINF